METKAVLFDLDGTLLEMDTDSFMRRYFKELTKFTMANAPELGLTVIEDMMQACEAAILDNCPETTIADIFWEKFCAKTGGIRDELEPKFENYYEAYYDELKKHTGASEHIAAAIKLCRQKGYKLCVATNPLFPIGPVHKRIRWAGLEPGDFDLITDYETMHYAKPNPNYFIEIAQILGVQPGECAMVGNHGKEDMVAGELGMKTFLLLGFEMEHDGYVGDQGGYGQLLDWIRAL